MYVAFFKVFCCIALMHAKLNAVCEYDVSLETVFFYPYYFPSFFFFVFCTSVCAFKYERKEKKKKRKREQQQRLKNATPACLIGTLPRPFYVFLLLLCVK